MSVNVSKDKRFLLYRLGEYVINGESISRSQLPMITKIDEYVNETRDPAEILEAIIPDPKKLHEKQEFIKLAKLKAEKLLDMFGSANHEKVNILWQRAHSILRLLPLFFIDLKNSMKNIPYFSAKLVEAINQVRDKFGKGTTHIDELQKVFVQKLGTVESILDAKNFETSCELENKKRQLIHTIRGINFIANDYRRLGSDEPRYLVRDMVSVATIEAELMSLIQQLSGPLERTPANPKQNPPNELDTASDNGPTQEIIFPFRLLKQNRGYLESNGKLAEQDYTKGEVEIYLDTDRLYSGSLHPRTPLCAQDESLMLFDKANKRHVLKAGISDTDQIKIIKK